MKGDGGSLEERREEGGEAMSDFGLASSGTDVVFASCMDERYPPENIVDGFVCPFVPARLLFLNRASATKGPSRLGAA